MRVTCLIALALSLALLPHAGWSGSSDETPGSSEEVAQGQELLSSGTYRVEVTYETSAVVPNTGENPEVQEVQIGAKQLDLVFPFTVKTEKQIVQGTLTGEFLLFSDKIQKVDSEDDDQDLDPDRDKNQDNYDNPSYEMNAGGFGDLGVGEIFHFDAPGEILQDELQGDDPEPTQAIQMAKPVPQNLRVWDRFVGTLEFPLGSDEMHRLELTLFAPLGNTVVLIKNHDFKADQVGGLVLYEAADSSLVLEPAPGGAMIGCFEDPIDKQTLVGEPTLTYLKIKLLEKISK